MNCPHCGVGGRQTVLETRTLDATIYRRRTCGGCGKTYVTEETAPPGLKMPNDVQKRKKPRIEPEKFKEIQLDLFKNW